VYRLMTSAMTLITTCDLNQLQDLPSHPCLQ
jgi:hypothetical protein